MSDIMTCEKCGTQKIYFQEGSTCGWTCPKCGWGVVTTYHEPIELDDCVYSLHILPQEAKMPAITAAAGVFSVNYLEARRGLLDGTLHVDGRAKYIRDVCALLSSSEVLYKVEPDFPYPIEKE